VLNKAIEQIEPLVGTEQLQAQSKGAIKLEAIGSDKQQSFSPKRLLPLQYFSIPRKTYMYLMTI